MIKKILIILFLLPSIAFAAAPSRTYNYVSHTTIDPTQNNTNENNLYTYLQSGVDTYSAGSITNTSINANAAIAYSKLNLLGSITNADISGSAGIIGSKLDLSSPGIIGGSTPAAGTFTTLTANTSLTSSTATILNGTVNVGSTHQGDIFYDNGTSVVRLTPGTNGQLLKTQGTSANPIWATLAADVNTSNVLFQYHGQVEAQGAALGEVVGTTLVPNAATGNYRFLQATGGASFATVWTSKFIKIAGISTVTIYGRIWNRTGANTTTLKIDIGGANSSVNGTSGQHTPEWKSFTIDVSGLSNGTAYDVTASLNEAAQGAIIVYCSDIMGFGS